MSPGPVQRLFDTVVDGGYCIGCGVCAAVDGSPIRIELTDAGAYQAELAAEATSPDAVRDVLAVCPFAEEGKDEDELAAGLFGPAPYRFDLGYHLATYAGYVAEGDFRDHGSSGGMAKWILAELLRRDLVDAVLHVTPADGEAEGSVLFDYAADDTVDGVKAGSRAAYYPVELSSALQWVRQTPGRYALTGIPCFIKAVRRLAEVDPVVAERVRFTVGIICGHLKTTGYAESLAWQLGVPPDELAAIDFRAKLPGRTAREKGVTAVGRRAGQGGPKVVQELFGTKYPHGFFKYHACNFCDDVVAETADVAVGDAWLPEYEGSGNSVVVVRDETVRELIDAGVADGRLQLDSITPDQAAATQAGGLRDRRQGLAYRLLLTRRAGRWHPPKRVAPSAAVSAPTRMLYRLRMVIPQRSIAEFAQARRRGDLGRFIRRMRRWTRLYEAVLAVERRRARVVRWAGRVRRGGG